MSVSGLATQIRLAWWPNAAAVTSAISSARQVSSPRVFKASATTPRAAALASSRSRSAGVAAMMRISATCRLASRSGAIDRNAARIAGIGAKAWERRPTLGPLPCVGAPLR